MKTSEQIIKFEWAPCIICGSLETKCLFSGRYHVPNTAQEEEFYVVQCKNCGLHYLNPKPTLSDIRKLYLDQARVDDNIVDITGLGEPNVEARVGFRSRYFGFYEELTRKSSTLRILDFLSRDGTFLDLLRSRYGWQELYACDFRPSLIKSAQEKGLNSLTSSIEQANFPSKFFDLITMRHTLEHLHNPTAALDEVHRILKDDGFLRIEVPNGDSLSRILSGRWWGGFFIPRHLYYFSPKTLASFLEKRRFSIEKIETFPYPHYALSILGCIIPKKPKNFVKRSAPSSLPGMATLPFSLVASLLGKGDEVMVICRKKVE